MPAASTNIKNRIETLLNQLKTAGTLGEVRNEDLKTSWTVKDVAAFPVAIITPPAIEADYFTNRQNERTYTFPIHIIQKAENISGATEIEELMEAIMDKIDNDPTMNGESDAGVQPAVSQPEPITSGDQSFVAFTITIKAKAIKNLTF